MNSKDYILQALQTKSPSFHGEKVSFAQFCDCIASCIAALQELDAIKKALFYGKVTERLEGLTPDESLCSTMPTECLSLSGDNTAEGIDVLHSILGIATEAGELLEALNMGFFGDDGFDIVNVTEELGDVFWYAAIMANVAGESFEEIQNVNIMKLRARFPDKFTEYDANNRNLELERAILEGNVDQIENRLAASISESQLSQAIIDPLPFAVSGNKVYLSGANLGVDHGATGGFHDAVLREVARTGEGKVDSAGAMALRLYQTTDAQVWAKEFMAVIEGEGGDRRATFDEGFVIGWFANAIENAKDHERRRIEAKLNASVSNQQANGESHEGEHY